MLRLNFPIPQAQTHILSEPAYSRYLEAERACIEAERAYFAALGWPPRTSTTAREMDLYEEPGDKCIESGAELSCPSRASSAAA